MFDVPQGRFFLRLVRVVSEGDLTCEEGSFSSCASQCGPARTYGRDICGNSSSSGESQDREGGHGVEIVINQSLEGGVCHFEWELSVPVCAPVGPTSTAILTVLGGLDNLTDCSLAGTGAAAGDWRNNSEVELVDCDSGWCGERAGPHATLRYSLQLQLNSSACITVSLQPPLCPPRGCPVLLASPATCSPGSSQTSQHANRTQTNTCSAF